MMRVARLLEAKGRDVVTSPAETTISDVARTLSTNAIGVIVVTDARGAIDGIISERDIVRGLAKNGSDFLDIPVSEVMSRSVITCTPENSVGDIMELMTDYGVRHLPVVEEEKLVGVISIVDVVQALLARAQLDMEAG